MYFVSIQGTVDKDPSMDLASARFRSEYFREKRGLMDRPDQVTVIEASTIEEARRKSDAYFSSRR